jgi:hypothetical protein
MPAGVRNRVASMTLPAVALVLVLTSACGSALSARELAQRRAQLVDPGLPAAGRVAPLAAADAGTSAAQVQSTTSSVPQAGLAVVGGVTATRVAAAAPAAALAHAAASKAAAGASRRPAAKVGSTAGGGAKPTVGSGPIPLGIIYPKNNAAAHTAVGAGGANPAAGDQELPMWQTLVEDLNARGGILGRKIDPVYVPFDAAGSDLQTQEQAWCASFTQDNHVFGVMMGLYDQNLLTCLEKAGVVSWAGPSYVLDDKVVFDSYPHYATAGNVDLTRLSSVYVDSLAKQGFFSKGATVGLVAYDDPVYRRVVTQAFKPALARHGVTLKDEAYVVPLTSVGAVGNSAPGIQNAVVRFATAGIDHVLFLTSSGLAFVWMTGAESQHYRPRYGLSSQDTPQALALTAPAAQLVNSVGVGWNRLFDVVDPGTTPQGKRCDALMQAHGLPPGGEAWLYCDQLWTFEAALKTAGQVNADAVMAALPKLGDVPSANVLGVSYAGGRRDGASTARFLAFAADCTCFHYTSSTFAI